ncbi:hypothetical protein C2U62_29565 [Klebsiella michiganensis]|nr:hypothetical protein [Klebsiella michiganensis]
MGYRQTNQKTDTGKTLTRWPVFVDHYNTPATDAYLAGIKADGVEEAANECYGAGYICETLLAYAQQLREGADK